MKSFEFPDVTEVLLTNINIRRELHGEDHVIAVDLSMSKTGSNDLLDKYDAKLRQMMYYNAAAEQGQVDVDPAIAILPNMRHPELGEKFNWRKGEKYKGYRLVLDYGLGDERSNVDFDDCTVASMRYERKEGGTCTIFWTVQYAGEKLTDEVRGKLTGLTQEKIHMQLLAPAVLQLGKTGKAAKADAGGDDEQQEDLIGGDDGEPDADELDPDSPEGRLAASVG